MWRQAIAFNHPNEVSSGFGASTFTVIAKNRGTTDDGTMVIASILPWYRGNFSVVVPSSSMVAMVLRLYVTQVTTLFTLVAYSTHVNS